MAKALNITSELSQQFAAELEEVGMTDEYKAWLQDQPEAQTVEEMLDWEPMVEEDDIEDEEAGMKALVITLAEEMVQPEIKGIVITPGGRVGDDSSHNLSPEKNWVEKRGGLPKYIRTVRNALVREGHSESKATAMAVAAIKRWARGGDNVSEAVQAAAVKALAQWEAMKGTKSYDDEDYEFKAYDADHGQPTHTGARPAKRPANRAKKTPYKAPKARKAPQAQFGHSTNNTGGKRPRKAAQSNSKPKQNNNPEFNKKHPRDQFGKFAAIQAGDGVNKKADPEKRKQIMDVQRALIKMGLLDKNSGRGGTSGIDGAFGPKTLAAIKKWQQKSGMRADGLLSKETIGKLTASAGASNNKTGKSSNGKGRLGEGAKPTGGGAKKRASKTTGKTSATAQQRQAERKKRQAKREAERKKRKAALEKKRAVAAKTRAQKKAQAEKTRAAKKAAMLKKKEAAAKVRAAKKAQAEKDRAARQKGGALTPADRERIQKSIQDIYDRLNQTFEEGK